MNDSILTSVKRILGLTEEYQPFDFDILMHINTVLGILAQMGIGTEGFFVYDASSTWADFLGSDNAVAKLPFIKTWVALKVRMIFDPPTSGTLAEAINTNLKELEWRMYITKNYIGEIGSPSSSEDSSDNPETDSLSNSGITPIIPGGPGMIIDDPSHQDI